MFFFCDRCGGEEEYNSEDELARILKRHGEGQCEEVVVYGDTEDEEV